MDLAEFVSDYLAIDPADGGSVTAREIAEAFVERMPGPTGKEFDAEVEKLIPQVEYYMG